MFNFALLFTYIKTFAFTMNKRVCLWPSGVFVTVALFCYMCEQKQIIATVSEKIGIHGEMQFHALMRKWFSSILNWENGRETNILNECLQWFHHNIVSRSAFTRFCCFFVQLPRNIWYKPHLNRQLNRWSLRCSWSSVDRSTTTSSLLT